MRATLEQRFDAKWTPEPNTGCWLWTAHVNNHGYGKIGVNKTMKYAHRVAYERWVGSVPDGLVLDHLCRVPSCVNPNHLEAVTFQENMSRGVSFNGSKTHCKRGHDLSDSYIYVSGSRHCKACARYRASQQRERANA